MASMAVDIADCASISSNASGVPIAGILTSLPQLCLICRYARFELETGVGDWKGEEWYEYCTWLLNAKEGVLCMYLEICWVVTVASFRDTILLLAV